MQCMHFTFRYPNLGGNPIATMNNVDQGYFVNPTGTYEYMNLSQFASSSGAKDNMDPRNFAGKTEWEHFVGSGGTKDFMDPSHIAGPSGTKDNMEIGQLENIRHQPKTITGQEFNTNGSITNGIQPSDAEDSLYDLLIPNADPHLDALGTSSIPRCFTDAVQQSDVGGSTVNYECFASSMQLSSLMELSLPLKTMVLNLSEEDELLSTSTSVDHIHWKCYGDYNK
ncbi:hypothetical protein QJS04_geneDACA013488 [Acorus gramineus]|uniref:Uncharacterized protein n=1 Tax=Acorus gramineus TaxID=55184 RepID=A0AAV9AI16_ACOGR|nr:hypothetical protein QJS04_geneDACA013488 [Acorus gramineus]